MSHSTAFNVLYCVIPLQSAASVSGPHSFSCMKDCCFIPHIPLKIPMLAAQFVIPDWVDINFILCVCVTDIFGCRMDLENIETRLPKNIWINFINLHHLPHHHDDLRSPQTSDACRLQAVPIWSMVASCHGRAVVLQVERSWAAKNDSVVILLLRTVIPQRTRCWTWWNVGRSSQTCWI